MRNSPHPQVRNAAAEKQALRVGTQVPAGSHVQQQNALKRRMREKRFLSAHTVMTAGKLRIVFMGTPDFAAKILRAVAAWEGGEVLAAAGSPCRAWTQAQGAGCQGHGAGTGHSCPSAAELPGTGGSGRTGRAEARCAGGGGLRADPAAGCAGYSGIRRLQRACVPAAPAQGRGSYPEGDHGRGRDQRRDHHAYGKRAGYRSHSASAGGFPGRTRNGRVSVRASGRTRRKAHGRRAGHDRGAARGLCAPE